MVRSIAEMAADPEQYLGFGGIDTRKIRAALAERMSQVRLRTLQRSGKLAPVAMRVAARIAK